MSAPVPMICRVVRAGQSARRLVRYIGSKAITLACDIGFGVLALWPDDLKDMAGFLAADHGTSKASEVRHIIFSVPSGTPDMVARDTLRRARTDWLKTYAPGRRWIAAAQDHNGKMHEHLAVANVGADGEPLKFGLREVISMAAMEFTSCAVSAKGKGVGKSVPVYPKAKNLAVRDLAVQLLDERGGMRRDLWAGYVRDGTVSALRQRKDGSLVSFAFGGRRIRVATLQAFLNEEKKKGGEKHHAPISTPVPDRRREDRRRSRGRSRQRALAHGRSR